MIERTNITIRSYEEALLSIATEELLDMTAKTLSGIVSKRFSDIEFMSFANGLLEDKDFKSRSLVTVISILRDNLGYKQLYLREIDEVLLAKFQRCIDNIKMPASKKAGEIETKNYSARTKNGFIMCFHMAYRRAFETISKENRNRYVDSFGTLKRYKDSGKKVDSVPVPLIRKFFSITYTSPLQEMVKDMIKLSFCLGGMNLGDMLLIKKSNYDKKTNRITYNRNKIKGSRADGGITSIRIEPEIQDLFDKYTSLSKSEYLFNFNGMQWEEGVSSRNFGMTVDRMCKLNNLPHISPYQFRHSVGTIGRNKCGFSKDDVGMLLNHKGQTTVDDAYIDYDWSINDKINRAILDYVFHSDKE